MRRIIVFPVRMESKQTDQKRIPVFMHQKRSYGTENQAALTWCHLVEWKIAETYVRNYAPQILALLAS